MAGSRRPSADEAFEKNWRNPEMDEWVRTFSIVTTDLAIALTPARDNPLQPQMGDHLSFHSVIRNTGGAPITGLVAWLSLIQTDAGSEQPVDLEDWSAHRAVAAAS